MCEPTTLAILAAGTAVVGGAQKALAATRAAREQAAIEESNAVIAERAATDAMARGAVAEGRARLRGGLLQGHQRAQYAAAGVDVSSGSPLDVVASTAATTELDAEIARNNAMREAWGYKEQAKKFRRKAQGALDAGTDQAIGSILGGIGGAATYGSRALKVE